MTKGITMEDVAEYLREHLSIECSHKSTWEGDTQVTVSLHLDNHEFATSYTIISKD